MKTQSKFFYGWVIVASCFLIAALPMVFISSTFSYYQMPICNDLGINYVQFNVCNTASSIAGMLFSFFLAGKLSKGNTRLYILIGGLITCLSLLAQSYIVQIWQLYLTFFVCNFAFSAMTYIPINFLISSWFIDRKGLATSIAFAGTGIGGLFFSNLIAGVIENSGWRVSFRIAALVTAATAAVVFVLIRKSPADMGLEPYQSASKERAAGSQPAAAGSGWAGVTKQEAVKSGAFWLCVSAIFCCGLLTAGIMTQLPTYLAEEGINYAAVIAIYSGVSIVSKLAMGPLFDKLGLLTGIAITAAMVILSQLSLLLVPGRSVFANAAAVLLAFGLTVGTLSPPLLAGRIFGSKEFGSIYGLANVFFMAGCIVGPLLASAVRTATGSYFAAWYTFIAVSVLLIIATAASLRMGRRLRQD